MFQNTFRKNYRQSQKEKQPEWIDIMLAKLTKEVFSYELLYELYYKMSQLEISTPTYRNPKELKSKNINWIKPELVAEMS